MKISFTIGDQTYNVPDAVTLELFEKATTWDINDLKQLKPFIATLTGAPLSQLNLLDEETFHIISGMCIQRIDVNGSEVLEEIEGYKLKDFNKMSFGNLIDIDIYISMSVTQNISKLAAIIYEADEVTTKKWNVKDVWAAIVELNKWRQATYREYDEFFELSNTSKDDVEASKNSNVHLMWYEAVMVLADGDFLKVHKVVKRPYREALNFLTWKKAQVQKQKLETLKHKNDLRRRSK